jgi:hypothetical protein
MRLSAGRIRSINRAMARTHASAYTPTNRNVNRSEAGFVASVSVIPPHTIRIVSVPKAALI